MRRALTFGLIVVAVVLSSGAVASAHPLGNFTVNTYSGLRVEPRRVMVDFVLDMAEIPTPSGDTTYARRWRPHEQVTWNAGVPGP